MLKKNYVAVLLTLVAIAAVAEFIYIYWQSPLSSLGPEQPIPFSHNVHVGVKQIP